MDIEQFGVFYTDGGYQPSKCVGGWGVHGYLYDLTPPPGKTGQNEWTMTSNGYQVTDLNNKTDSVNVLSYIDFSGGLEQNATNNRAELTAMIEALRFVQTQQLKEVWIYSDSQYVVQGATQHLSNWITKNWVKNDGEPVVNQDLWKTLHDLLVELKAVCVIHIEWIKGHASQLSDVDQDFLGNKLADQLATTGIMQAYCGNQSPVMTVSPAKKYWKPDSYRHPLLTHTRWYFNTARILADYTDDGYRLYYFGNHGKDDDFLGKPMSDASFSVLMTRQEEPVLEKIRYIEKQLDRHSFNSLMIGRLDHIFKPAVYQKLQRYEGWCVRQKTAKLDLYTLEDLQLTKELRPPRLAYNLIEVMEILEGLLYGVFHNELLPGVVITDVTDQLYTVSSSKKPKPILKESISQSAKGIKVTVNHPINEQSVTLDLSLGLDCPPRATLSKLAPHHPRTTVLTWRDSPHAFRHAFCVQTKEDAAIYAGFYSNIVFIKQEH